MTGPCAKVVVTCTITAPGGPPFTWTNSVRNPQSACPREPQEGYGPCVLICRQDGHAEILAIKAAGLWAVGATARVHFARDDRPGHVCPDCLTALAQAGVVWLVQTWGTTERRTFSTTPLPILAPRAYPVGSPIIPSLERITQ